MLERFFQNIKDKTFTPDKLRLGISSKIDILLKDVREDEENHRKVQGYPLPKDLIFSTWPTIPDLGFDPKDEQASARLMVGSKERDGDSVRAVTLILEQSDLEAAYFYHLRVSGGDPLLYTHTEKPGQYAKKAIFAKETQAPTKDTMKAFNKFLDHVQNLSTK